MTVDTEQRRKSFDTMASQYARARPTAPPELFDALAAFVPPPAELLEIGCGPGNATLPLAQRGYRIHAVELGANLAELARERLAGLPFSVEVCRFEDAQLSPASADLVVCASAFHWLDLPRALAQVAKVLRPGGGLALFWPTSRRELDDPAFHAALEETYRTHAPTLALDGGERLHRTIDEVGRALASAPELRDFEERRFAQELHFDGPRFVELLGTFSDHATLPAEVRARLFDALRAMIDARFGGKVTIHTGARLLLARRR